MILDQVGIVGTLVALRRFRHLLVLLGALLQASSLASVVSGPLSGRASTESRSWASGATARCRPGPSRGFRPRWWDSATYCCPPVGCGTGSSWPAPDWSACSCSPALSRRGPSDRHRRVGCARIQHPGPVLPTADAQRRLSGRVRPAPANRALGRDRSTRGGYPAGRPRAARAVGRLRRILRTRRVGRLDAAAPPAGRRVADVRLCQALCPQPPASRPLVRTRSIRPLRLAGGRGAVRDPCAASSSTRTTYCA